MGFFSSDDQKKDGPAELSEKSFGDFLSKGGMAVVMVYMPGCGHCKRMEPAFQELREEMTGTAIFARINAPANIVIARRYDVSGTPTILIFKGGELVKAVVGERVKEDLRSEIKGCL